MKHRVPLGLIALAAALAVPLSEARAQDSITITSPTAGDVWEVGSTEQITWETTLTDVTIRYSTDDGATWTPITATVDSTSADWLSFPWQVPDQPSTTCKIHIEGYTAGEAPTDSGTFEIRAASDGGGDDGGDDDDGGGCAAITRAPGLSALTLLAGLALFRRRR